MPVLAVNDADGTFTHRCVHCGHTAELRLDPLLGDLTVTEGSLVVRMCPECARATNSRGQPVQVYDCLTRDIPAWEAGEIDPTTGKPAQHPQSLVGTVYTLPNGLQCEVIEHHIGYSVSEEHLLWRRNIRQMQRHPHLAPHAPLRVP